MSLITHDDLQSQTDTHRAGVMNLYENVNDMSVVITDIEETSERYILEK